MYHTQAHISKYIENLHQCINYFKNSSPNKTNSSKHPRQPFPAATLGYHPPSVFFDLESVDTSLVSVISKLMGLPLLAWYPLEWLPDNEVRKTELIGMARSMNGAILGKFLFRKRPPKGRFEQPNIGSRI